MVTRLIFPLRISLKNITVADNSLHLNLFTDDDETDIEPISNLVAYWVAHSALDSGLIPGWCFTSRQN